MYYSEFCFKYHSVKHHLLKRLLLALSFSQYSWEYIPVNFISCDQNIRSRTLMSLIVGGWLNYQGGLEKISETYKRGEGVIKLGAWKILLKMMSIPKNCMKIEELANL